MSFAAVCGVWGCAELALPDGSERDPDGTAERSGRAEDANSSDAGSADAGDSDRVPSPWDSDRVPPPIEVCFAAGTQIATPDGPRAIESLEIGDAVFAYDQAVGARVVSRVTATHHHPPSALGRLQLADGRSLRLTPNHPVYAPERDAYVPAGELTDSASVLDLEGAWVALAEHSFELGAGVEPVFNISVEAQHNYFAGGVLVHNKSLPPCDQYDWSTGEGCDHPVTRRGPQCGHDADDTADPALFAERLGEYWLPDPSTLTYVPGPDDDHVRNDWLRRTLQSTQGALAFAAVIARVFGVNAATITPAGAATPADDATLDEALWSQLIGDIARLAAEGELRVSQLLGYQDSRLTPELASYYGVSEALQDSSEDALHRLPEPHAGLLTQGAFLRAHPTPSARGAVLDAVLACGSWPAHTPPMPEPLVFTTRREAYAALAAPALACSECHAEIDAIGFALEQFDAAGRYRPEQAGQTVLSTTVAYGRAIEGPSGLGRALSEGGAVPECVARALLEDALGRALSEGDDCSVQWVADGQGADPDLMGMFLSVMTSPAFLDAAP